MLLRPFCVYSDTGGVAAGGKGRERLGRERCTHDESSDIDAAENAYELLCIEEVKSR